ncbi:hypothetical protein BH11ACT4_BH11ACT4_13720 [soil metagenome]
MTFFDAIKTVFRKYAEFTGRATRPEFWWFTLFSFLVSAALSSLNVYTTSFNMLSASSTSNTLTVGSSLAGLWSIAVLLPSLAVAVRRLRDAGYHWTQLFWVLLPIAGAIVLIVRLTEPSRPADATVAPAATAAPVATAPAAKTPTAKAPTAPKS